MALWLEQKYVNLVSSRLEKFKKSGSAYNFRCPICGDSQKNKNKARGYLIPSNKGFYYSCHNCGMGMSLAKFIERLDPFLFQEYKLERMKETGNIGDVVQFKKKEETQKPKSDTPANTNIVTKLSELDYEHHSVIYCRDRHIPISKLSRIGYTKNLRSYVLDVVGAEKYRDRNLPQDERIIFEMRDSDGRLFGFQARAIGNVDQKMRFITIKLDENFPKVYGLDAVDLNKYPVFVTEGIIDSLFLPNCLAICGGDVGGLRSVLSKVPSQKVYVCLDNEPRHKDTISRMNTAIDMGYNVMFWEYDTSLKDINDMIKSGLTTRDILASIKGNSLRGAAAKMRLGQWKR